MKTQIPYYRENRDTLLGGLVSVHFNSLLELYDLRLPDIGVDNQREIQRFDVALGREPGHNSGHDWYGPTNMTASDVVNHALLGDQELYVKLQPMADEISRVLGSHTTTYRQQVLKAKRVRVRDIFGDTLDIHRVYQGQIDKAWERRKRIESNEEHNLITILVDIGGTGSDDVLESLWRAAATLKIVDDYEKAGKSVKLLVGTVASGALADSYDVMSQTITVKNYNERLPLERVAAMCHLGFHRTFSFASRHCQPYAPVSFAYGRSIPITHGHLPITIRQEIAEGRTKLVIVPRCTNMASAIDSVKCVYSELAALSKAG